MKPLTKPIILGEPRELTRQDLTRLQEPGRGMASIQRLRASHHRIAMLKAMGWSNVKIAADVGMTRERVGQLLQAPAMADLVAQKEKEKQAADAEAWDAYLEAKRTNMLAAERHIADRFDQLDEEGELMPVREALAVSADAADRLGYAKRTVNTNVNVDFGARLDQAIARSGKVIEAVAEAPVPAPVPLSPSKEPQASPRPLITRRVA